MSGYKLQEFDLLIAPDGKRYRFNGRITRFLFPIGDLGMPPMRHITQRGPFQHGRTLLDYFLEPRVIQMIHRRNALGRQRYWDIRADILNHLRPNRSEDGTIQLAVLRKVLPDGSKRDLDVFIERGPTFNPPSGNNYGEWSVQDVIRFISYDPTFYDPDEVDVDFTLSFDSELEFDIEFPITFGAGGNDVSETIRYAGTWETFPTITITGPLDFPVITNVTTGKKIDLEYELSPGEIVTITTAYGNKTVTNDAGDNLIGKLSTDSDLGVFSIVPDPEAEDGDNVINLTGTNARINRTALSLSFLTRYIGI